MFWNRIIKTTLCVGAALSVSMTGYTAEVKKIEIDNGIIIEPAARTIKGTGEMLYLNVNNVSVSGAGGTGAGYDSLEILMPSFSYYKFQMQSQLPASFQASGRQLATVVEVKFKAELKNKDAAASPAINYALAYRANNTNVFIEGVEPHFLPTGEWITLKYVLNPVATNVKVYKNDSAEPIRTFAADLLAAHDMDWIRFYPRTLMSVTDSYLQAKDDNADSLGTPVIWTIDYLKISQITPFDIESSAPENYEKRVEVNYNYRYNFTFDTDMDKTTLTAGNFSLNRMDGDVAKEATPIGPVTAADRFAAFNATDQLAYFTTYRMLANSNVKDSYGLSNSAGKSIYFTTQKSPFSFAGAKISIDQNAPLTMYCNGSESGVLKSGALSGQVNLTATGAQTVKIVTAVYSAVKIGAQTFYQMTNSAEEDVSVAAGSGSAAIPAIHVPGEASLVKVHIWGRDGLPLSDSLICKMGEAVAIDE